MRKNPWVVLVLLMFVFGVLFFAVLGSTLFSLFGGEPKAKITTKNTILHLQLQGIIMDGKRFLKPLNKFAENPHVKAIVVEINSPGGVVGPSQEMYYELLRVKEELKKPVVAYSSGVMASGAYYAAVAADKIVVAPGVMMGSIGVIMEFLNLEKLYDWAKVSRYTITTGKFKDSGAEYRSMREDEKEFFQNLVNSVYDQFVEAVAKGRNLPVEDIKKIADGRVFTGQQALGLKLVDELGTYKKSLQIAADLAGLGSDYEVFDPPKRKPSIFDLLSSPDDEEVEFEWEGKAPSNIKNTATAVTEQLRKLMRTSLNGQPLYLMPGVLE